MLELSRITIAWSIFYWQVADLGLVMRREWNKLCRKMVFNGSWVVAMCDFWDFHCSDVA
jgi:hypothetical protein